MTTYEINAFNHLRTQKVLKEKLLKFLKALKQRQGVNLDVLACASATGSPAQKLFRIGALLGYENNLCHAFLCLIINTEQLINCKSFLIQQVN